MRRTPLYFAGAGLELARYFALVYAVGPFAAGWSSGQQILRLTAAPNTLFAVMFLFLGIDSNRYEAYRPLLAVGKAVALFSGIIALPRLFGFGGSAASDSTTKYVILAIAVWDTVSSAMLAVPNRKRPLPPATAAANEPERVEID